MSEVSCQIDGKTITIETGIVAKQSDGAVWVKCGGTVVLVTAVAEMKKFEGDFFPLTCEYREKAYATGRIPGGYFKREGRPTTDETLMARLMDRPIRPCFPKGFKCETQIIASPLSADRENGPDILAMIGASAALHVSDIPFNGPLAAVRVGMIDGKFIINPSPSQLENSSIDLVVAGSRDAVSMVEGGARIIQESVLLDAIFLGHQAIQPLIDMQEELRRMAGKPKRAYAVVEQFPELGGTVREMVFDKLKSALFIPGKMERRGKEREIFEETLPVLTEKFEGIREAQVIAAFEALEKEIIRKAVADEGKRLDGRGVKEVRPITCRTGVLPQTHGSAIFTRGETQVLATVTLGTREDEQKIESISGDWWKTFLLHYNFPPYCVGEVRRNLAPGRRDIGHGALAERAIEKIIPPHDDFPYTIRIVSEVLESNGSSSMGTVCAGSMGLMDAGAPVKDQVAGIAMGLIKEGDKFIVLSDIMGDEDHHGDMDFKVAGTKDGVTAFQMDVKISGVTREIMGQALNQAKEGRLHILGRMNETISKPRPDLSPFAPRITTLNIPVSKIKDIIGPGGKIIRHMVEVTGATIDVEDDGTVHISSMNGEANEKAINMIKDLTAEAEVGKFYMGTVRKIMDFGAFVEIIPGTDGLLHISRLEHRRVEKVTDILKEGDKVLVKCIGVDSDRKISLSRKEALGRDINGNIVDPVLAAEPPREEGNDRDGERGRDGDRGDRGRGRDRRPRR